MFQATHEIGLKQFISEAAAERLEAFAAWIDNIAKMCEIGNPIDAIKEMLDDMGYEAWLHQNSSSPTTAERRMANVWYLIDSLKTILERAEEEDEDVGIKDAIAKLVLRDMLERQAEEEETDQVQLMTMHASKGLEFPHVYIVGMEEEILPHRSSIEEDNIEEERRLAYVGITRAKQTLTMTLASKRKQFGEMMDCLPSRFLDEIPEEDLEREGFGDDNPELNQRRGRETMADLKNMFD
jgi:ATP-dependent DNA helicase Rep